MFKGLLKFEIYQHFLGALAKMFAVYVVVVAIRVLTKTAVVLASDIYASVLGKFEELTHFDFVNGRLLHDLPLIRVAVGLGRVIVWS